MVFLSQRAPIERVVGVARGLGDQHDVFVVAHPMLEAGCSLHWGELALIWMQNPKQLSRSKTLLVSWEHWDSLSTRCTVPGTISIPSRISKTSWLGSPGLSISLSSITASSFWARERVKAFRIMAWQSWCCRRVCRSRNGLGALWLMSEVWIWQEEGAGPESGKG
jgi:hypothetical protein